MLIKVFSFSIDTRLGNSNTPKTTNNGNTPIPTIKVVTNGVPPQAPPPPPPPVIGNSCKLNMSLSG